METQKKSVLFLCTANSCRSQIAEALVNAEAGQAWQAFSAGTLPAAAVHPMALQVLEEAGIHHPGVPKSMDSFRGRTFDLVVTVCADSEENCPVWLGAGRKMHVAFDDPAKVSGDEETRLNAFRHLLEEMRHRLLPLLEE